MYVEKNLYFRNIYFLSVFPAPLLSIIHLAKLYTEKKEERVREKLLGYLIN